MRIVVWGWHKRTWRLQRVLQCLLQDVGDSLNHHSVRSISGSERSPLSWRRLAAPGRAAKWAAIWSVLAVLKLQAHKSVWIQANETVWSAPTIDVLQDPKVQNLCKTVEIPQASYRRNVDTVGSLVEQHTMDNMEIPEIQGIWSASENEVDHVAVGQVVQHLQMLLDAVESGFFPLPDDFAPLLFVNKSCAHSFCLRARSTFEVISWW